MKDHEYLRKIYYHDTDCGGVVYYANYLKFCEEARDSHFAACGYDLRKLNDSGVWFVVGHVEVNYRAPARFGDELTVLSRIERVGGASIAFSHQIRRGEYILNESTARIVCVGADLRPQPVPADIKNAFTPI
jgi:acyl-CoA thioester hydrolase